MIVVFCVASNLVMAVYFCMLHQRGLISTTDYIRQHAQPGDAVCLLIPCHSMPAQCRLHIPQLMLRMLRCDPGSTDTSSDDFFARNATGEHVQRTLSRWGHCDYVVTFEPLFMAMSELHWTQVMRAFHAHFPSDSRHGHYIGVWKLRY
jgi:hypothetical protein